MSWDPCDDMFTLMKEFFSCTPVKKLTLINEIINGKLNIDDDIQLRILNSTVNAELIKRYPVRKSYQKAFLKSFMEALKNKGTEIHDEIFVAYCDLLSSSDEKDIHYRHFFIKDEGIVNHIKTQESINIISKGTTGLCTWQGAIGLAEWSMKNKELFTGKIVLELGCGIGLSGLAIIPTCSPKMYIFSDCHPLVLDTLCKNIKENLSCEKTTNTNWWSERSELRTRHKNTIVEAIFLDWGHVKDYTIPSSLIPDIIVAADILYDTNCFDSLTNAIKSLLERGCKCVVIVATVRNENTLSIFLRHLDIRNLIYEESSVPESNISIRFSEEPMRIYRIFLKT